MRRLIPAAIVSVTVMLGWMWWAFLPASPIVYFGGHIEPSQVRAGEMISITRTFRIDRSGPMKITRAAVMGDCKLNCRIYEFPDASVVNHTVGSYMQTRQLRIPKEMVSGVYRLTFQAHWSSWWGRDYVTRAPELTVEVIE